MAELKMTPRRLLMLRAIGDGAVTEHYPYTRPGYSQVDCVGAGWNWSITSRYVKVTARVAELRRAGLCEIERRDASRYRHGVMWALTDAGRAVLEAADE